MTIEIALVLAILFSALVLFVTEKVRPDVVALMVTFVLIVTKLVTVDEAFAGFASPAVVTVWAVFIISAGLQRSGVADIMAHYLLKLVKESELRLLLILMLLSGLMSAFMNNIGAVAILMPITISIGRKLNISISRLLMPLAFAALLGGNITLIGTPPNILANGLLENYNLAPFSFFDFAPTGMMALAIGIIYMLTVGRWLLPNRAIARDLPQKYTVRDYLSELRIASSSPLVGKPLFKSQLNERYGLNVARIRQPDGTLISPLRTYQLRHNDILLVEGGAQALLDAQIGLNLDPTKAWSEGSWRPSNDKDDFHLAELTLAPNSTLSGQTLKQINFRRSYGLTTLALRHGGENIAENIGDIPLNFGDTLLVQGPTVTFENLLNEPNLMVLESPKIEMRRLRKAPHATFILLCVVVIAAGGWLDAATAMLGGVILTVLFGILTMQEAYRAIDWTSVFLIAGMLPLGTAMEQTGTAELLAQQMLSLTGNAQPLIAFGLLFVVTTLLTSVISNAAATVLLVPIAITIAQDLGVSPYPFVIGTVLAASTSFLLPVGHQVNILIFSVGSYRFSDYAKVGVWLNLLILLMALLFVPLIWPF